MTIELIISLIALALALFAAIRTFFDGEKVKNQPVTEIQPKAKREKETEDIIKKTLQSIEEYRK
ncbi:hypothetical protein SDC9_200234 [bioreactor metagenome]|uniref:Uncharacterized protein n=1 Tax=bioreactor metagenome TaxID=1076179 RepID=A0A645INZ0_9ZZZZ